MFYAVASAVLANEVDVVIRITILIINNRGCGGQRYHLHHNLQIAKHKRRELEEGELLEQEREEMLEQVEMMDMIEMMEREEMLEQGEMMEEMGEQWEMLKAVEKAEIWQSAGGDKQ